MAFLARFKSMVHTWDIAYIDNYDHLCVASAPAGKLDATLRRLAAAYGGISRVVAVKHYAGTSYILERR